MRVACLQFSPELGKPEENIDRANALLNAAHPQDLDLLVLPELAFSGYNFASRDAINPYLEPTESGLTSIWARGTAAKLDCIVHVGYPEVSVTSNQSLNSKRASPTKEEPRQAQAAYNSTITVTPAATTLAHYRKTHLYYTDETWAQESPSGWLNTTLTFPPKTQPEKIIDASFGICMDLNQHQFTAPWDTYEFSSHALSSGSGMLILSMAWLTNLTRYELAAAKGEPDLDTLSYWIRRLKPLVMDDKEVVVVLVNRCGEEPGKGNPATPWSEEEGVRYAGSSWVGKIGKGEVRVWNMLGRAEEGVLVVDTEKEEPRWVLRTNSS